MSNYLSDKGSFIISATATPSISEQSRVFHPASLKTVYDSLADETSGRTDDGTMHITWVYQRIRRVEIAMPPMSPADASVLLALVQGQIYYITYWDVLENAEKTIQVYTSTSNGDCYSGVINNGIWQDIAFNAIELAGETDGQ